ncbi:hypothetical protein [Trichormus azollae]
MSLDKASEECAARVMETVLLLMRFIRVEMRTHSSDSSYGTDNP